MFDVDRKFARRYIFYLSDIAAVQLLAVALGDAIDVMVTTYEINLVYTIPPGQRTWLLSYSNHNQTQKTAFQIGRFLDRPVLDIMPFSTIQSSLGSLQDDLSNQALQIIDPVDVPGSFFCL